MIFSALCHPPAAEVLKRDPSGRRQQKLKKRNPKSSSNQVDFWGRLLRPRPKNQPKLFKDERYSKPNKVQHLNWNSSLKVIQSFQRYLGIYSENFPINNTNIIKAQVYLLPLSSFGIFREWGSKLIHDGMCYIWHLTQWPINSKHGN